jgi:hypothetical protein
MSAHDDPSKLPGQASALASDGPANTQARKGGGAVTREDRLKAALKANMGRRKAQARARAASDNNEKE